MKKVYCSNCKHFEIDTPVYCNPEVYCMVTGDDCVSYTDADNEQPINCKDFEHKPAPTGDYACELMPF